MMKKHFINLSKVSALSLILVACSGSEAPKEVEEMPEMTEEVVEEVEEPAAQIITLIAVEHKVADYDVWYAGYLENSDPESRIGILINMDDESLIHVAEKTSGHDAARERLNSDEMKATMAELGVTSEPTIRYLNIVEMNKDEMKDPYRVALWHTVSDFDAWKVKFDEDTDRRTEAGMSLLGLGTVDGEDNMVFMMFSVADVEKVKEMLADPALKEKMEEAGVTSKPEASYWRLPDSAM